MRTYIEQEAMRALTPTGTSLRVFGYSLIGVPDPRTARVAGCPFCYVRALPIAHPRRSMGRVGNREDQPAATAGAGTGGASEQRQPGARNRFHVECDGRVAGSRAAPGSHAARAQGLRAESVALPRDPDAQPADRARPRQSSDAQASV